MSRTAAQIRSDFLEFFRARGHTIVPGSPVVPHADPTLLFTNAGMNQFKPLFLGTADRNTEFGRMTRAANSQPCIRAGGKHNDLDDVGHDTYHHTLFEMLGNWSFGDYFKKEAIEWAWELVTRVWGLDPGRLHATYFGGDEKEGLEPDLEARDLWRGVPGMSAERVHPGNKKDNFWEMGDTGPCGPCSEIHIDLTPDKSGGKLVNAGDERVIEFWNLVFIQFNRGPDGKLTSLPAKHVDTGMGLERIVRLIQGKRSNYDIDVFTPIFAAIQRASGAAAYAGLMEGDEGEGKEREQPPGNREQGGAGILPAMGGAGILPARVVTRAEVMRDVAYRVIADHIRTLTFAISDGCMPDKEGRGYVLRRILRRAVRYGWQYLDLREPFLCKIVPTVVEVMGDAFPHLRGSGGARTEQQQRIAVEPARVIEILREEEQSFARTLERGMALFEEAAAGRAPNPDREGGAAPNPDREEGARPKEQAILPNPDREGGAKAPPVGQDVAFDAPLEHRSAGAQAAAPDAPLAYLITFRTYGTWLPGSEDTVDEQHNTPGEDFAPVSQRRAAQAAENLKHGPVSLDDRQRPLVESAIREVAAHRGWNIHALNVRTNHVHVVVAAGVAPEKAMTDFKAYATRRMKQAHALPNPDRKEGATTRNPDREEGAATRNPDREGGATADMIVWARHGSTRYLWDMKSVSGACAYVLEGQGEVLAASAPPPRAPTDRPLPHGQGSEVGEPVPQGEAPAGIISGEIAFKLHDTYGFPIDLTQIMAQERGLMVDIEEYERLMEGARAKARGIGDAESLIAQQKKEELRRAAERLVPGACDDNPKYNEWQSCAARVESLAHATSSAGRDAAFEGQQVVFTTDRTCFYAEQGGQVGDTGWAKTPTGEIRVNEISRYSMQVGNGSVNFFAHSGIVVAGEVASGQDATMGVDVDRRIPIMRNHTATHILNWALREVLDPAGQQLQQKGSLVDPDKTRFDFSHSRPVTPEELERIEELCADQIRRDLTVYAGVKPQAEALRINGLRAVFGEKYPEQVRVVSIGASADELLADPANPKWRQYSIEFCGGTHVASTGEIGNFVLVSEEGVAKGVRRLVGVTGDAANKAVADAQAIEKDLRALETIPPAEIPARLTHLHTRLNEAILPLLRRAQLRKKIADIQQTLKDHAKASASASADAGLAKVSDLIAGALTVPTKGGGQTTLVVADMGDTPVDALKTVADAIKQKCGSVAILFGQRSGEKATLLAAVTDDLIKKGVKAGDWVKAIAPTIEGGGGGPPTMAQAGGKNPAKLTEALESARTWVQGQLA